MAAREKTVIHWFRKGLRLHDNPALIEAVEQVKREKCALRPIFILDPNIRKFMKVGPNRWRFLLESLRSLDANLKGIGSRLYVVRGTPEAAFPLLFKRWNVSLLTFETDTEPYAVERDERVEELASASGVRVAQKVSHTIYDPRRVIAKNGGRAPMTYQKFLSVVSGLPEPEPAAEAPADLPGFSSPPPDEDELSRASCYDPPTAEELGLNESDFGPDLYPGGETEALERLRSHVAKRDWICKFEKPNTAPNSLEPSTTVLSPYLKFGCLSSTLFYHRLKAAAVGKQHTKPPVSLLGQLFWREFYYTVSVDTPNFDKMVGNKICCQVPWRSDPESLAAWKEGRTGYPFIDAIMRQLKQEGWIHHLARHAVACFLTRGDLWISWEEGLGVFEEYLLDADWALNAGNWMWLSASAFFHQFFRVYSPVAFGKKTDKTGSYIKKYVPELKKFPPEYIYEPWSAPISFQKSVNCLIGKDYPKRIVIHEDVYKENISKMSLAYKNNKLTSEAKKREPSKNNSKVQSKKRK